MARNDWVALITEPAAEYRVRSDLERLGLRPYLPQARRRWCLPSGAVVIKLCPVFIGVLLLPLTELCSPAPRGLHHFSPVLTDDGRLWRIPSALVSQLMQLELNGAFDAGSTQRQRAVDAGREITHRDPRALGTQRAICDGGHICRGQIFCELSSERLRLQH
jgi:hypothetical protein